MNSFPELLPWPGAGEGGEEGWRMFTLLVLPHQPRGGSTSLWPSQRSVWGSTAARPEILWEAFWAAPKIQMHPCHPGVLHYPGLQTRLLSQFLHPTEFIPSTIFPLALFPHNSGIWPWKWNCLQGHLLQGLGWSWSLSKEDFANRDLKVTPRPPQWFLWVPVYPGKARGLRARLQGRPRYVSCFQFCRHRDIMCQAHRYHGCSYQLLYKHNFYKVYTIDENKEQLQIESQKYKAFWPESQSN